MQIIESIYLLLDGLYSESLRNYLSGYDCASASFSGPNVYAELGLHTAIIVLLCSIVYYKVLDPTENKLFKWFMSLLTCALIAMAWAYYLVSSAENKGLIGACLLRDDNDNALIGFMDYLGLGTSNAIIAAVLYFVLAMGMKFISTNNRYIPF